MLAGWGVLAGFGGGGGLALRGGWLAGRRRASPPEELLRRHLHPLTLPNVRDTSVR
jgi:hypothetical protein